MNKTVLNYFRRKTGEKMLLAGCALLSLSYAIYATFDLCAMRAAAANRAVNAAIVQAVASANSGAAPATVADVVAKALAFKAMLTPAQQATLEQTYTPALARRWSNLPDALCGGCRNGILFSALTDEQLAAALEVVKAAAGTIANEGSAEFSQILLADNYLGANGGGGAYGQGNYHMAFLNTPSVTGAWMLQFGGHHYAVNISYNQGHVVAGTPHFLAIEPLSFTTNGVSYAPIKCI